MGLNPCPSIDPNSGVSTTYFIFDISLEIKWTKTIREKFISLKKFVPRNKKN
jgi:hypothetical protein